MSDCRNSEGRWPPLEIMRRAKEVDDTGLDPVRRHRLRRSLPRAQSALAQMLPLAGRWTTLLQIRQVRPLCGVRPYKRGPLNDGTNGLPGENTRVY